MTNDPCEDCRWSPPSASDGKPCCSCDPDDPLMNCYEKREVLTLTNADRIRAMTDEELAEFLCDLRSNGSDGCDNCHAHDSCWAGHTGFIDWLRKEADT